MPPRHRCKQQERESILYKPARYCFPIEIRHKAVRASRYKKYCTLRLVCLQPAARSPVIERRMKGVWRLNGVFVGRMQPTERDTHIPARRELAACPYRFCRRRHRCQACSVAISHMPTQERTHMPAISVQSDALICVYLHPS